MSCLLNPFALATHSFESFQIVAEDRVGLHAVLQTTQLQIKLKLRGPFFRQLVDHPLLVPLRQHQAVRPQVGEVFGNSHLGHFQNALKVADAERPLRQEMKDAKASFIAQAAVDLQKFHIRHRTYTATGILCQPNVQKAFWSDAVRMAPAASARD